MYVHGGKKKSVCGGGGGGGLRCKSGVERVVHRSILLLQEGGSGGRNRGLME